MINRNHFRHKIGSTYTLIIGNNLETLGKKDISIWELKKCAYLWATKSKKQIHNL